MPELGTCRAYVCGQIFDNNNGIIITTPSFSIFFMDMKRFLRLGILFSLISFLTTVSLFAQEKKPTIMILPSDNWCDQRYFMMTFNDQGRLIKVPDYQTAYREDSEIGAVISQVGQVLTDLGYSVKDSEQEIKKIAAAQAEDNVTTSSSGAMIAESPLDILKRKTKADIIIQIGWQVNKESKGRSVSFTIEAFDSYTSKRIATATGISKASSDIVPRILASAIKRQIKPFDSQMCKYFYDLQANGREITFTVRRWDGWDNDLETEINGNEIIEIIQTWLRANTINSNFNLIDSTENFAQFEQVRIPFFDEHGVALDARGFVTYLRKFLSKEPYNIPSKVLTKGLGEAIIVLGEK